MPIYEFACPKCRVIYSFLSKRVNPERTPKCPKCGNKKLTREISRFAMIKGVAEPAAAGPEGDEPDMSPADEARMMRVMSDLEKDMDHLDENNPRHMAHMMRKMKEAMPDGMMPKEMDIAIKRLEKGEDPEKIEEDMGDVLGEFMGGPGEDEDEMGGMGGMGGYGGGYSRDGGLYDY
ncbi:MAG: zinc ribbon domain-containing protein [Verrucomicrobiales bacterium]|nr:zinc ribbon domain-containing protein [Verrucomicrobiales bacterium]